MKFARIVCGIAAANIAFLGYQQEALSSEYEGRVTGEPAFCVSVSLVERTRKSYH